MKKVLPFIAFLALAILQNPLSGDTVIDQKFDGPLTSGLWRASSPEILQSVVDGQLVMKADSPDPAAYAVVTLTTSSPMSQLNFTKKDVTIKLTDLMLKGSAAAPNQVFLLSLYSDKPGTPATSALRFRITPDGTMGSIMIAMINSNAPQQSLWQDSVSLPIKSASLTFDSKGIKIAWEDAMGSKTGEVVWPGALSSWENSSPYLNLETHRSPGTGNVEATLGGLSVVAIPKPDSASSSDSTPALK